MEKFDVIIVGAGPSGLKAAEVLGNAGKKVLLLEKNSKIGPKVCAGGLTRKSKEYLNIPDSLIEKSFSSIIFQTSHFRTKIDLKENYIFLISREKLGQWQLTKINSQNVIVRENCHVTKIENNFLIINDQEKVGYRYLIGADGSASIVRRYLGLPTKFYGVAIQYLIPQNNHAEIEIHFDSKKFSSWYAWIFPRSNYASIGYGHPAKNLIPWGINTLKLKRNFEIWAEKNKLSLENVALESFPINCDYRGYKFGNIFLTGDAAGLASGFTGEGIYQALVSGEEVANTILNKNFKAKLIKKCRRERNIHHLMLVLVYLTGPFRNIIFDLIALSVKINFLGRTLLRILS